MSVAHGLSENRPPLTWRSWPRRPCPTPAGSPRETRLAPHRPFRKLEGLLRLWDHHVPGEAGPAGRGLPHKPSRLQGLCSGHRASPPPPSFRDPEPRGGGGERLQAPQGRGCRKGIPLPTELRAGCIHGLGCCPRSGTSQQSHRHVNTSWQSDARDLARHTDTFSATITDARKNTQIASHSQANFISETLGNAYKRQCHLCSTGYFNP